MTIFFVKEISWFIFKGSTGGFGAVELSLLVDFFVVQLFAEYTQVKQSLWQISQVNFLVKYWPLSQEIFLMMGLSIGVVSFEIFLGK